MNTNRMALEEIDMSVMLKQIEQANENNRRNLERLMEEYDRKVVAEMNGKPMTVTRHNDEFVIRKDGVLEKVASAG